MQVPKPERMGFGGKAAQEAASVGDDLWELHAAGVKVLEFARGRSDAEYGESEVLRTAVTILLGVMAGAAVRIAAASDEMAGRLHGVAELRRVVESESAEAAWGFVRGKLPELVASAAGELGRWHEGGEMKGEPEERVWDLSWDRGPGVEQGRGPGRGPGQSRPE